MADLNYGELYANAIAQSGAGKEVLPDGDYSVEIASVKPDVSGAGKFKVGIMFVVKGGPHDGKRTWINQTFSPEGPKAATAIQMFLKFMRMLGVPQEAISQGQPPPVLVGYIAVGTQGLAKLGSHGHGTEEDGITPRRYQDLKAFTSTGIAQPMPSAPMQNTSAPAPVPAPAAPFTPAPAAALPDTPF